MSQQINCIKKNFDKKEIVFKSPLKTNKDAFKADPRTITMDDISPSGSLHMTFGMIATVVVLPAIALLV
ncbi:MAG: hypothetical protein EZS28_015161 [Streblomastix strix]|uniref:Uncharacterized protein n=1 Tax=Streblomastix strix TaxID=222440 RepID=A0A5J4W3M4_9EUKA|nr:MAG: hypothetical protein EZS28_015161 [Streblomastix strix]